MSRKATCVLFLVLLTAGLFMIPPEIAHATTTTETVQISNGDDDFFQLGNGDPTLGTNIIIFYHPDYEATAFLRFRDVDVPQNAIITSAVLSVYRGTAETTGTEIASVIWGIDDEDCPQFINPDGVGPVFTNYPKTYEWESWNTTVFSAGWHNVTITNVVAEVIARLDWESGNSLGLMIESPEDEEITRAFWSYEYSSTLCAKLYITYQTGAPAEGDPGYPDGIDPLDQLEYNSTFTYNGQTLTVWELRHMIDAKLIMFYGKAATADTFIYNQTSGGDPGTLSAYEMAGQPFGYYDGKFYAAVVTGSNIYLLYSTDLVTWATKVNWSTANGVTNVAFAIDDNGIVYFAYVTTSSATPTWRYRDFDLVGDTWKNAETSFKAPGSSVSYSAMVDVWTKPNGSKQYYTANAGANVYAYTRDGWADGTFTEITVYDGASGYDVRWCDVTHWYNATTDTHYAYFFFGVYHTTPANQFCRGYFMKSDDTLGGSETVRGAGSWSCTFGARVVRCEWDIANPGGLMLVVSLDYTLYTYYNPNHGLAENSNWGTITPSSWADTVDASVDSCDLAYASQGFDLIYAKKTTRYPTLRTFNETSGAWSSESVIWNYKMVAPPTSSSANDRGAYIFRHPFAMSTDWIIVAENGTILDTLPTYPTNDTLIDIIGDDPLDPNPPGWDTDGIFTRYRMRGYMILVGLALFFIPLIMIARLPEGTAWYIWGPAVMLLGLALAAAGAVI